MQKGKIGVSTENIFPIIKKFLYSDHEIFLRELVSNAVDASNKLRTLASMGEFKGELGDQKIHVILNPKNEYFYVFVRSFGQYIVCLYVLYIFYSYLRFLKKHYLYNNKK